MTQAHSDGASYIPATGPLRVFISSTMSELIDGRAVAERALRNIYVDAFVYERKKPVGPSSVLGTCLTEVANSDLLVALFSERWGEVTVEEFRHARRLGKPCFVYVRGRYAHRDPRIEKFLHDDVYSLEGGVTCGYFDDAVELGDRLGRDIMTYLVYVYRQARREVPVGVIAPVVRLAWDVADWYRAFGWQLVTEPLWRDNKTIDLRMKIDQDLPGFGKVCRELRLRAVTGLIGMQEAKSFIEFCGAEKGQLISDLAIEPAAQRAIEAHKDISVQAFDHLLDQTVRFDNYLDWLEADIKRRGIDTGYVSLTCVEGDSGSIPQAEQGAIDEYVDLWLQDWHKEHLSIVGEFGTGKTWCILHIAWTALQRYREAKKKGHPRPRIPLVIPLRDFARAVSIESLFSEFFFRQHNIGIPSYEMFVQLNRMGKLLLLFDGFDEMAARIDRQKMINNFWEFARVLVPGGKAILTCRTEHFPNAKEGRALLNAELQASTAKLTGVPPQFKVVELQKFNDQQLREVLARRAKPATIEKVMANPDLVDLARRPLMVELILEALPDVEAGAPVDLSRVYLYAVRRKMDRDIKAERTFTSLADKLYFLCELSIEMLLTDQMSLNYRLFPDRLRRLFGNAVWEEKELDHWHFDMLGQTMLVRNADGDYSPAHRSLVEFFVAYKFVAQLGVLAPDFTELAREQSYIDKKAAPRDYTWFDYFHRKIAVDGRAELVPPLRSFVIQVTDELKQKGEDSHRHNAERVSLHGDSRDFINVDRLPRNALAFAAGMVSRDPSSLDKLSRLALEATGTVAWNVQSLLPLLKHPWSEVIAKSLIEASRGRPVRNGVAWVLGELGVATLEVIDALEKTLTSLGKPGGADPWAWWESGFALEKLGRLGPREGRQGNKAVACLIQNLPLCRPMEKARKSLLDKLRATDHEKATINHCDIVTIVKHETEIDCQELFRAMAALIDFSRDTLGRRCYYVVWLCGHLGIRESADSVIQATEHSYGSVRNIACEALGKIGDASPAVIEALEACLKDKYYRTRYHAAWSLGELKSTSSIPTLIRATELEEVRDVRDEMIRVRDYLEKVGSHLDAGRVGAHTNGPATLREVLE